MNKIKRSVLASCIFIAILLLFQFHSLQATTICKHPVFADLSHYNAGNCMLNMPAQKGKGGYDLAFVYINSHILDTISIAQYNQDGTVSNHGKYISFKLANTTSNDSTVVDYTINFFEYGILDGTIALGPEHTPLEWENICDNCKSAILSICPKYDVLLMDLQEHIIYDICEYDYEYTFRNYRLQTSRNRDGTISISIIDTNLHQINNGSPKLLWSVLT